MTDETSYEAAELRSLTPIATATATTRLLVHFFRRTPADKANRGGRRRVAAKKSRGCNREIGRDDPQDVAYRAWPIRHILRIEN